MKLAIDSSTVNYAWDYAPPDSNISNFVLPKNIYGN